MMRIERPNISSATTIPMEIARPALLPIQSQTSSNTSGSEGAGVGAGLGTVGRGKVGEGVGVGRTTTVRVRRPVFQLKLPAPPSSSVATNTMNPSVNHLPMLNGWNVMNLDRSIARPIGSVIEMLMLPSLHLLNSVSRKRTADAMLSDNSCANKFASRFGRRIIETWRRE